MDVSVDRERCIGLRNVRPHRPGRVDQDDDGRVLLHDPAPPGAHHAAVRETGQVCTAGAIAVLDR